MRRRALLAAIQTESSILNNEIWYTSLAGNVVAPRRTDVFGANLISNTYNYGRGVITFDGDVTMIGDDAFEYLNNLTSITLPDSVTSIGDCAFNGCRSLLNIYCMPVTPPTLGGTSVFDNNGSRRKIYVPAGSVNAYKSATRWSEYASDIIGITN